MKKHSSPAATPLHPILWGFSESFYWVAVVRTDSKNLQLQKPKDKSKKTCKQTVFLKVRGGKICSYKVWKNKVCNGVLCIYVVGLRWEPLFGWTTLPASSSFIIQIVLTVMSEDKTRPHLFGSSGTGYTFLLLPLHPHHTWGENRKGKRRGWVM